MRLWWKRKKGGRVKKGGQEIAPYPTQRDFDRMMNRFEREFEDFWAMPPMMKQWMHERLGFPMMPFKITMPSVDVEDRGKDFRVSADLPGFNKEDVNIEITDDSVTIHAKKTVAEEEKNKNYIRRELAAQSFYRRIELPEKVKSDDAKASLNNGILEIILTKKKPKETKKLQVT